MNRPDQPRPIQPNQGRNEPTPLFGPFETIITPLHPQPRDYSGLPENIRKAITEGPYKDYYRGMERAADRMRRKFPQSQPTTGDWYDNYLNRLSLYGNDPRSMAAHAAIEAEMPEMYSIHPSLQHPEHAQVRSDLKEHRLTTGVSRKVGSEFERNIRRGIDPLMSEFSKYPSIEKATHQNMDMFAVSDEASEVRLALELCPLYEPADAWTTCTLDRNPTGRESIGKSVVAGKWDATLASIEVLQKAFGEQGKRLAVSATYGDRGILLGRPQDADPDAVKKHGDIYQEWLTEYCGERGISLDFARLSEMPQPENPAHQVPQFVIAEGGRQARGDESIEELLDILQLPNVPLKTAADKDRASILKYGLENCGGNIDFWRGFMMTYLHFVRERYRTTNSNIHLGMERADWLLKLQSLRLSTDEQRQPAINIAVATR